MRDTTEERKRYLSRLTRLRSERSGWDVEWRELADFIQPRKSRFFTSETNVGRKRGQAILNGAATRALKIQSAGMLAGITSPARPWLRITTEDPGLGEWDPVKDWLDLLARRVLSLIARTNLYNTFHSTYSGLGCFGTHAFLLEEDPKTVLRAYQQPMGEYCLAADERGEVDTVFRELRMTVRQTVQRFGLDVVSNYVREAYERGNYDSWVEILHAVHPREGYDTDKDDGPSKPWASCWLERTGNDAENLGLLRESGYDENPLIATRWDVLDGDVYGTGPGHEARGDTKGLQLYERRIAQGVSRMIDPPLTASTALQGLPLLMKSGQVTYADPVQHGPVVQPTIVVNPAAVAEARESRNETAQRIREAFGSDLWLLAAQSGDPQKTAREIAERHEEKLLQLGPVMERQDNELLTPTVNRTIAVAIRRQMLPPPPRELQGQAVKLEYQSIMAMAQRMVAGSALQQGAAFVEQYAAVDPEILDGVDGDKMVRRVFESLGIPPDTLRTQEEIQQRREARAQQQAQQARQEQALAAAQRAKTLSQADTSGDNALTSLVGGVAAAQAEGQT